MLSLKHKLKIDRSRWTHLLAVAVLAASATVVNPLLDPSASAASKEAVMSQTFALYCYPNPSVASIDSQGNVFCGQSSPNEYAQIDAVGAADAVKKKDKETIVKVDCGSFNLANGYNLNSQVSQFSCANGSSPTIKVIANGGNSPSTSPSSCDYQVQATCPYCAKNNPNVTGCINPQSDSAVTCISSKCDLVKKYVNPFIGLFSVIFGLLAAASLILGGINFTTSEGDPQKAAKAKQRIFNTVFAVVAYIFLYAFLQFLVPGGLFNK